MRCVAVRIGYGFRMFLCACIGTMALQAASAAPRQRIRLEAENGQLIGVTVAAARHGYSGSGYVTGFRKEGDKVVLKFRADGGIYDAVIGYSAPNGGKGYELEVNGSKLSGMFAPTADVFAVHRAGKVELKAGENILAIGGGWNYYDIDYIDLIPAAAPGRPALPPKTPVDSAAVPKARALLADLVSRYGLTTLSGVYSIEDADYVRATTGRTPAILGDDLMDYSPSRVAHGSKPDGTVEQLIAQYRKGYLLTVSWHWNAPTDLLDKVYTDAQGKQVEAQWWRGFYTFASTFDVQKALDDPNSQGYRLIVSDIDAIAVQLRKFAAADIPILWRPLHEAEGRWFWWGAHGPRPFVKLWRLMYDRLTNHHHLHNLIWVYTSAGDMDWYPGDAAVDIIGVDLYPSDRHDPQSGLWEALQGHFAGKKLLAITEFGPVPDIERMHRFGAYWSYFVSWSGRPKDLPKSELQAIYRSPYVTNRKP